MYYFEYPSFASMLLREIRYGVELSLDAVSIDPFLTPRDASDTDTAFQFHAGNVRVSYSRDKVVVSTPRVNDNELFAYDLNGMHINRLYEVSLNQSGACAVEPFFAALKVTSSVEGKLSFRAPRAATPCEVVVSAL
jgi:hypothetical protein